jgi:hypothetical protein
VLIILYNFVNEQDVIWAVDILFKSQSLYYVDQLRNVNWNTKEVS